MSVGGELNVVSVTLGYVICQCHAVLIRRGNLNTNTLSCHFSFVFVSLFVSSQKLLFDTNHGAFPFLFTVPFYLSLYFSRLCYAHTINYVSSNPFWQFKKSPYTIINRTTVWIKNSQRGSWRKVLAFLFPFFLSLSLRISCHTENMLWYLFYGSFTREGR